MPANENILIFCDGACSGNPGPGGWGAILALPSGLVRELGGGSPATTNNQMEMTAALAALEALRAEAGPVTILTDSVYVIKGITQWIWGWRQRGWRTADDKPVANRELWEKLSAAVQARGKTGKIEWKFVKGHAGNAGNERVDQIAVAFSKGTPIDLYNGPTAGYSVSLEAPDTAPVSGKSTTARGKTLAYLSCVGGQAMRHATWAECEKRVKGKSGAKFKKVTSEAELDALLKEWGGTLV